MMTGAEDRRITSLIVDGREPSRAVIYSRRVRKRGQESVTFPMRAVGLVIGFKLICKRLPYRVIFKDFSGVVRIDTRGIFLRPFEDGWLIPLALSTTDLRGAIFAQVVMASCDLTLRLTARGPISVEQLYFDCDLRGPRGEILLPILSLNTVRKIVEQDDRLVLPFCL